MIRRTRQQVLSRSSSLPFFLSMLALAGLLLNSLTAQAQAPTEKPERYQVDLIVFESYSTKGWLEEFWPQVTDIIDLDNTVDLTQTAVPPLDIEPSEPMLQAVVNRMTKHYRILRHYSWSQNVIDQKETPEMFIEGADNTSAFYGKMKLYQSRFNHVTFNLNFEKAIPTKVRQEFALKQKISEYDLPATWQFQLNAKRKIRSGELHYIDHPLFGILIQIKEIKTTK